MIKLNYHNTQDIKNFDFENKFKLIDQKIDSVIKELKALNIVFDNNLLKETITKTKNFAKDKKTFVVLGTGGSNLGARALVNILDKSFDKNVYFYDNIDPINFEKSLRSFNIKDTGFVVISKSGSTPETLSQLGAVIQIASEHNMLEDLYSNFLFITEFKSSPLFNIAKKNQSMLLEHNKDIGGRYSVFSNVGIVPAILAGLDTTEIHNGAKEIINNYSHYECFRLARLFKYQVNTDFSSSILMTYSDNLYFFGKWYLQLWAESIGKDKKGITPIHSVGTTDQHSQLQLYLQGPSDKFFSFITTDHYNKGLKINNDTMLDAGVEYLVNKKMGDLMEAEQQATIQTFINNGFKIRNIHLPKINAFSIGSLMALSIIETIAACLYFNVNPFDQPAVEEGKVLTKEYLLKQFNKT